MPLTLVSLTGADDKVTPAALAVLSARYANSVPLITSYRALAGAAAHHVEEVQA